MIVTATLFNYISHWFSFVVMCIHVVKYKNMPTIAYLFIS